MKLELERLLYTNGYNNHNATAKIGEVDLYGMEGLMNEVLPSF